MFKVVTFFSVLFVSVACTSVEAGTCKIKGTAWSRVCDRAKKIPYTRVVVKDTQEVATAAECVTKAQEMFDLEREMGACRQTKKLKKVKYKFKADGYKVTGKFKR